MSKPILPDDEFRWQQRIEDSVGRLQRAPARMTAFLTGATGYTFRDLSGDSNFAYRVIIVGRLTATSDLHVTIRPTGFVPGSTTVTETRLSSRNQCDEHYNETNDANVTGLTEYANDAGLFLAQARWATTCDINAHAQVSVHSSRRIQHTFQHATKPNGSDPRTLGGTGHGFLYHERRVTAIEINMGGGTFTGAVGLEPLF